MLEEMYVFPSIHSPQGQGVYRDLNKCMCATDGLNAVEIRKFSDIEDLHENVGVRCEKKLLVLLLSVSVRTALKF